MTYVILALFMLIIGLSNVTLARLWEKHRAVKDSKEEVQGNEEDKVYIPTNRRIILSVLWFFGSLTKCYAYYTPVLTLVRVQIKHTKLDKLFHYCWVGQDLL